jgi:hypothetical protein
MILENFKREKVVEAAKEATEIVTEQVVEAAKEATEVVTEQVEQHQETVPEKRIGFP